MPCAIETIQNLIYYYNHKFGSAVTYCDKLSRAWGFLQMDSNIILNPGNRLLIPRVNMTYQIKDWYLQCIHFRISSVNVTKSAVFYGFCHICLRNS